MSIKNEIAVNQLKSNRKSNIELLRIVAMFLILIYHSVFLKNGIPTPEETNSQPIETFFDLFLYASAAVGVNVFVLISGWFGIHCKRAHLGNFLFQVLFYFLIGDLIGCCMGILPLNTQTYIHLFTLSTEYWFVYAYLGLYLFAPILNAYIEKATSKALRTTLICFFLLQTWYGWFRPQEAPFFYGGHSTISFVGLYLLARYLRLYAQPKVTKSRHFFIAYICLSLIATTLGFCSLYYAIGHQYTATIFQYISPLILLSSLSLFLTFTRMPLPHTPSINRIAISAFSVYLIHTHETFYTYMESFIGQLQNKDLAYPMYLLILLLSLLVVYCLCTCIDQIRLTIWKHIQPLVTNVRP